MKRQQASTPTHSASQRSVAHRHYLPDAAAVTLIVAAFSLRPAVASVGPVLDEIRHGSHMSATAAGVLTAMPAACFAAFGSLTARLVRSRGPGCVLAVGMLLAAVGLATRPLAGTAAGFIALSAMALAGIGLGNVVMPIAVKASFADRLGRMTGLYSMSLTAGAAVAAGASIPLMRGFGGSWRASLAVWALPAAVASAMAWNVARRQPTAPSRPRPTTTRGQVVPTDRTTWSLAVFFGLQAAGAYVVLGWMPKILRDAGVAADEAGLLLALTPVVGVPLALVMPTVAARLPSQCRLVVVLASAGLLGYLGLMVAPATTPWIWAMSLGVSQASFPLALTMIGLRAATGDGVTRLSAFVQGMGYFISIPCPIAFGALFDRSGASLIPLGFLCVLLIPQTIAGVIAGLPVKVDGVLIRARSLPSAGTGGPADGDTNQDGR